MTAETIKTQYPKCYKALLDHYSKQVAPLKGLPAISEVVNEKSLLPLTEAGLTLLFRNPANKRQLMDWFDTQKLYLTIVRKNGMFRFQIEGFFVKDHFSVTLYEERQKAEEDGYDSCFRLLEETL